VADRHGALQRAPCLLGAASWNWAWNRALTFSHRQEKPPSSRSVGLSVTSLLGFAINVGSYYV